MPDPIFLNQHTIYKLYIDIAEAVGVGIKSVDSNRLGEAAGRPQQRYVYDNPQPDIPELAAWYAIAITRSHPGNKRTALAAMLLFLEENCFELIGPSITIAKKIEAMVAREITEDAFIAWVNEQSNPQEPFTEFMDYNPSEL